ncbi:aldolase/citrate lyase family protein [uncultured Anaeromusa sp.]|uniref:aldolase/citrate lyase family protein n=1 Tax=uncultured Anaeromusa sp. TaxID=673273 RepID=UPI0029C7242D|nr:aldolase/citrate lyase family protein [uncultured Anaeromusa sp.]
MMKVAKDLLYNPFKAALKKKELQVGLWLSTATPYMAEIAATAAYDWLLIDGEHAPNTMQTLYGQLQAVEPYKAHPVIRIPEGSRVLVKQALDIGAQTLLVPMINSAAEAKEMVLAMKYPPEGVRGVGASVARASRWGRVPDYMKKAEENLCLLVQVETKAALENLDEIASVEGVDGVFIGPADLSASLGYVDDAGHPDMQAIIEKSIKRIRELGKAAGTLAVDPAAAKKCIEWGATFVAVGVDTMLYTQAIDERLALFKQAAPMEKKNSY